MWGSRVFRFELVGGGLDSPGRLRRDGLELVALGHQGPARQLRR